jgi:hypothetical protein
MVTEMERECKEDSSIQGTGGALARDQFPGTVGPLHDPHDTHTQRSCPQSMCSLALVGHCRLHFYACKSVLSC